jgi:hypothetical protein
MNKVIILSMFAMLTLASATSCNTYKSASKTTGVSSQLLGKVSNVLMQDMTGMLKTAGMEAIASKLTMGTKIGSLIKGATMINSFKSMLSSNYKIPMPSIEKAYSSFGSLQDVAGFIGKNASPSFLSGL